MVTTQGAASGRAGAVPREIIIDAPSEREQRLGAKLFDDLPRAPIKNSDKAEGQGLVRLGSTREHHEQEFGCTCFQFLIGKARDLGDLRQWPKPSEILRGARIRR